MKKAIIKVADEKPSGITQKDYDAAKKTGEIECNYVTAITNVRLSKGLYELKPEPKDIEAEYQFQGVNIEQMTRAQLFAAAMTFGVTIKNKGVPTAKLRAMVQTRFQEFVDAEDEPDGGGSGEPE